MKPAAPVKKQNPFLFVLDELFPLRPVVKTMFGFTHVYLDEKLLLSLRYSEKEPRFNGVWLYTEAEHLDSLRAEFPSLPAHRFWESGKKGWVILTTKGEDFEEYAFKACEMILRGDPRIGRITRKTPNKSKKLIGKEKHP